MEQGNGKGLAIASMVLGICGLVFTFIIPLVGVICAVVGLILAIIAKKKAPSGLATAGLVCSIIALAVTAIVWISCIACAATVASELEGLEYYY